MARGWHCYSLAFLLKGGVFIKTLYKVLTFALAVVGMVYLTTTTAYAVDSEETIYLEKELEVGDTAIYYCKEICEGDINVVDLRYTISEDTPRMCFYLQSNVNAPSGYTFGKINVPSTIRYKYDTEGVFLYQSDGYSVADFPPYEYNKHVLISYNPCVRTEGFRTNIPIFETKELAQAYVNGNIGVEQAINYKKSYEDGSWVSPFEDIEINDNQVPLPTLSNLSHKGFTLTNNSVEQGYLIEVYCENGLQNPTTYCANLNSKSLDGALYQHTEGLLNPIKDNYEYTTEVDVLAMYGYDNETVLSSSVADFYTTYPSAHKYDLNLNMSRYVYDIWGAPFGKNYVFFSKTTTLSSEDIARVSCSSCPLAYTTYKVRYFYYDDTDGWHYGPWSVYTYFSGGKVGYSSVYQDDIGIIESGTSFGTQDNVTGDISINQGVDTNFVDLNNPNELFGYIRSVVNNINATTGTFGTMFATFFSFIPTDIQAMIWFGIAVTVVIGVIKVIKG